MIPQLIWTAGADETLSVQRDGSELELRTSFLRQQWEVSGPGQLSLISDWLRTGPLKPISIRLEIPADRILACAIDGQNCRCDALLHDVDPGLPETQRVTWTIATAMIWQIRDKPEEAVPGSLSAKTAGIDKATVAAALTFLSAHKIGALTGEPVDLFYLAMSSWGLHAGRSDIEWAIGFLGAESVSTP